MASVHGIFYYAITFVIVFVSQTFKFITSDVAQPWQLGFQDSASPSFSGIVALHDTILFYLVVTSVLVFWLLAVIIYFYNKKNEEIVHKYLNHGTLIEVIWTITPALVLLAISFPSYSLLYVLDEINSPNLTIKVVGHQWYWSFEYSDYVTDSDETIEFDSYMVPENDLELGQFRLLDVDQNTIVPVDTFIRLIVTATDVLHDYAVPSLGIKVDAVPGRLNQASMFIDREGSFYGQCSEICGVYHGFMPTCIESVRPEKYLEWLSSNNA